MKKSANQFHQGVAAFAGKFNSAFGVAKTNWILDLTFGVKHVSNHARNAGSRCPFRPPNPLL
ncbi:MAG: hypothetical protein ABI606_05730, partial [Rhodoferax sp.]